MRHAQWQVKKRQGRRAGGPHGQHVRSGDRAGRRQVPPAVRAPKAGGAALARARAGPAPRPACNVQKCRRDQTTKSTSSRSLERGQEPPTSPRGKGGDQQAFAPLIIHTNAPSTTQPPPAGRTSGEGRADAIDGAFSVRLFAGKRDSKKSKSLASAQKLCALATPPPRGARPVASCVGVEAHSLRDARRRRGAGGRAGGRTAALACLHRRTRAGSCRRAG